MNNKLKKILRKKNKSKIVCLTAYSKSMARILDNYCDIILVGDSMASVLYGMDNTHSITLNNIIQHAKSVKKGVKKSVLIIDMPKGTYQNLKSAKKNAKLVMRATKCDGIKIESNNKNFKIIEGLVKAKIPVMGHIGYTPQFKKKFQIHGLSSSGIKKLISEAKKIDQSGAFSIVLECIASKTAKRITKEISIPTIGIGSSRHCDGQILVTDDMLGLSGFYPKFVKKYENLSSIIEKAVKKYSTDVKLRKFPQIKHFFNG